MASTKNTSEGTPQTDQGGAYALTPEQFEELKDMSGTLALMRHGLDARDNKTIKNRIIAGLFTILAVSIVGNIVQFNYQPETKVVGETPDGRFRPIPLLTDPLYDHKQIMEWSSKCVQSIYRLSYVDWQQTLNNETFCLSDGNRPNFSKSLKQSGLSQYLTAENQGNLYAVVGQAEIRKQIKSPTGYSEWIVNVPYRVNIDGRQRGSLDVEMTMKVRRVSLAIRGDGLWVESYVVRPRTTGR